MMTFEEFIAFRDVQIKNLNHERIVRIFYKYLESVTQNNRLLPDLICKIIDIDSSSLTVSTGCFNGINTIPPYDDVDFYIILSNDIRVFIYGSISVKTLRALKDNEYVLFVLTDDINDKIERNPNKHIYIGDKSC